MNSTLDLKHKEEQKSNVLKMMLRYFFNDSGTNNAQENNNEESEETEPEAETELDVKEASKDQDLFTIQYFSFDENLREELEYNTLINLYQKGLYEELVHAFTGNDYKSVDNSQNDGTESYTAEEAKKTLEEAQYSSILGVRLVGNYEDYRKLNQWIMFNPALFALFQSVHNLNKDIDYRPPA